ncbi:protein kinase domain-containing protein [Streptomyces sp. 4N509B]|uniref:protein kinase domain-containing protein n=1 Tax=Streptomyces sp. 4N509B TaxID=3457413 RepID=UPI003FD22914
MLRLPLPGRFRYVHEPLPHDESVIPVLGHEDLTQALSERLLHSRGGTFLVTGFQGVGKSTLVHRALARTARAWDGEGGVLLVAHINMARSMTADQLLFVIVRRVFETLHDQQLLPRLPPDVRESLETAYIRTSLSFTQTQSETSERTRTIGLGAQQGPLAVLPLGVTGLRSKARATEAAFLAYSETDVEHDLVRIIQLLNGTPDEEPGPAAAGASPPGATGRARRRGRGRGRRRDRRAGGRLRVHPVIVLDEIDKLTDGRSAAIEELEGLLRRLKGVLTTRGAHFVLVAGTDLHDQALDQTERGTGVYESVFSWHAYVPCLWDAPQRLVDALARQVGEAAAQDTPEARLDSVKLNLLTRYLRFRAKGIPRRLLQEFNAMVCWEPAATGPEVPCLRIDGTEWERVDFFAHMEAITQDAVEAGDPARLAPTPIDTDRWRMSGHHIVEWALRSEGRPFAVTDVAQHVERAFGVGAPGVDVVLRHLAEAKVLEVASERGVANATLYGGSSQESELPLYRLTDEYRRHLVRLRLRRAGVARPPVGVGAGVGAGTGTGVPDTTAGGGTGAGTGAGAGTGQRDVHGGDPGTLPDPSATIPGPRRPAGAGVSGPSTRTPDVSYPYTSVLALAVPPLPLVPGAPVPGSPVPSGPSGPSEPPVPVAASGPGSDPAAEPDPPLAILANRYALWRLVGQGGMAAVYQGRDLLTGQPIAVKMMHVGRRVDAQALDWFRREAQLSLQVHHPNVVRTLDAILNPGPGSASSEPAIIQELVEGPSLDAALEEAGSLTAGRTVLVARQVSEALKYLAGIGLVRIDIKPSNIVLHPVRGAVIANLGLALRVTGETPVRGAAAHSGPPSPDGPLDGPHDASADRSTDRPHDQSHDQSQDPGELVGTPAYMAPERLAGGRADVRGDLYALGLLMVHCLTGELPGGSLPLAELQMRRLEGDVVSGPLARAGVGGPGVSPELQAVIRRVTARDPDSRYATPAAFQNALDATPEGQEAFGLLTRQGTTTTIVFAYPRRAARGEPEVDEPDADQPDADQPDADQPDGDQPDGDEEEPQDARRGPERRAPGSEPEPEPDPDADPDAEPDALEEA